MTESPQGHTDDRVAVVTGAGQGIGRAIAVALAARGVRVVVTDRNTETGTAVAKEVGGDFLSLDVSDPRAVAGVAGRSYAASTASTSWSTTRASPTRTTPST